MTLRSLALSAALLTTSLAAQAQSAIDQDPAPDKANPAALQTFQLPSHGALLNALVYVASGAGPHPVVLLLHGFPGNEKNLDLAQTLRRAGYDVLFFNYRGSWGAPAASPSPTPSKTSKPPSPTSATPPTPPSSAPTPTASSSPDTPWAA